MPRFSTLLEQCLDYNVGWCWRIVAAAYYRIKES